MTQQIALRISDELARKLDETLVHGFATRSEALRVAIEEFVERRESTKLDKALTDGYSRLPPTDIDEWGSVEAAHAVAATILARSLDAEDGGW
jgi:Arc/MetJ-type ribon-helix-helix transcriptional regulator